MFAQFCVPLYSTWCKKQELLFLFALFCVNYSNYSTDLCNWDLQTTIILFQAHSIFTQNWLNFYWLHLPLPFIRKGECSGRRTFVTVCCCLFTQDWLKSDDLMKLLTHSPALSCLLYGNINSLMNVLEAECSWLRLLEICKL